MLNPSQFLSVLNINADAPPVFVLKSGVCQSKGKQMNPKVLFLDDDATRQQIIKSKLPFIDQAYTAKGAISFLRVNDYDFIFLDHDLGNQSYVNSSEENTGAEVARWMRDCLVTGEVIVHSFNPAGADYMMAELSAYRPVRAPFMSAQFKNIVKQLQNWE